MFNKNPYTLHHLPQAPSLSHHHHHHQFHSGADEILFHHHDDMLSGHYFAAAPNAPAVDAAAFYHHQDVAAADPKKTTKKDRHSKIYTSQGPRDRRVRLSIGVARRFFDLQEILGFDKPSKTLDWLLTNSTTAIKDLMQTKEHEITGAALSSPSSDCEADSGELVSSDSKKKQDLAKESRVKARARARERTREKMCIKQLNDELSSIHQHMISGGSSSNHSDSNNIFYSGPSHNNNDQEHLVQHEESINVIKTKVKHFLSNNSSNYALPSTPNYNNPTDNWDICAILDSHKFINREEN